MARPTTHDASPKVKRPELVGLGALVGAGVLLMAIGARWFTGPATIFALVVTSGSPPPGWLEPPTRYNPGRAPRLAGRTNAARRPFDEVP